MKKNQIVLNLTGIIVLDPSKTLLSHSAACGLSPLRFAAPKGVIMNALANALCDTV